MAKKSDTGGLSKTSSFFRKRKQFREDLKIDFEQWTTWFERPYKNSRKPFEVLRTFNDHTIENVSCDTVRKSKACFAMHYKCKLKTNEHVV